MNWLEAFGWTGSVLVVLSLVVARATRFRWLNLIGCVIAAAYNLILGIWPYLAMNVAICAVNIYWLRRLRRTANPTNTGHSYRLLHVGADDPYLSDLLDRHSEEVRRYYPSFTSVSRSPESSAYLALAGDQVAGLVLTHQSNEGIQIELDYALPGHRDLSLGRFLYAEGGLAEADTARQFWTPTGPSEEYFSSVGFQRDADRMTYRAVV